MEKPKDFKITKIKIPDKYVQDWIKTLMEENFSAEEIDQILSNLNDKYKEIKLSVNQKIVNEAFLSIQQYLFKKYNIIFFVSKEEKNKFDKECLNLIEKIKKGYKEDFNEEISQDLLKKILITMLEQNVDKKFESLNQKSDQ